MSDRHCCWDGHTCPNPAVAVVAWRKGHSEHGYMVLCQGHLTLVRMKAAIRGMEVVVEGPNKARGGQ